MFPNYDPEAVRPMWEELAQVGVRPLSTADEVKHEITEKAGTTLIVVNSVCGCAAGSARPGVMLSLQHKTIPDNIVTVFAGMDHDATARARAYMEGVPPSSPCIALFKDGELLYVMPRQHIEQMDSEVVARTLTQVYKEHCTAKGPSIPEEEFAKINPLKRCGSTIPMYGL